MVDLSFPEEKKKIELTEEEISERRKARKAEQQLNPNYLQTKKTTPSPEVLVDNIPVAKIDLNIPLHIPGMSSSDQYLQNHLEAEPIEEPKKTKKGKKSKKGKGKEEEAEPDYIPSKSQTNLFNRVTIHTFLCDTCPAIWYSSRIMMPSAMDSICHGFHLLF